MAVRDHSDPAVAQARRAAALCATVVAIGSLGLLAQVQVNPAVNTRANQPLYPAGTTGSLHNSTAALSARTSVAMQSEVRNAYWRSGSMPSDFKAGYAALGPRPEGGAIRYVNYKPSYVTPIKSAPPAASAPRTTSYGMGSIRYASPTSSANMVQSRPRDTRTTAYSGTKSTQITHKSPSAAMKPQAYGSVRYVR
jgi:hypothetical protein